LKKEKRLRKRKTTFKKTLDRGKVAKGWRIYKDWNVQRIMLNPESGYHPTYPVTDAIRKKHPKESERWESLLHDIKTPQKKGCFTCEFYNPLNQEFVDVESVEGYDVPWDTEQAFVNCSIYKTEQTSLKVGCPSWKHYESRAISK
jgi:hypothetical protein